MFENLAVYTTFGIGGPAKSVTVARSRNALVDCAEKGAFVIGGGSNILVSDSGYDGPVVVNRYAGVETNGELVTAASGTKLGALCRRLYVEGLSGLEWACDIPGSVGGAVKMNAGAFSHDISESFEYADVLRGGKILRLYRDDMDFSYRHSAIADGDVVIDAAFRLKRKDRALIASATAEAKQRRALSRPEGRSAGSVFKNPPGMKIAKLIDEVGFKGYRVGGAAVSKIHANVIVNLGGATANDVVAIVEAIKRALLQKGVSAEEEIVYLGYFG